MITREDLAQTIHIATIQSESGTLLEKALCDLNTLKHATDSEELKRDINIAMDLLKKHEEAFSLHNIQETILMELSDKTNNPL